MGTNYYVQTDEPCCHCYGTGKRYQHLGKFSCGWPFLLNPFMATFKAIKEYIKGRRIVNEYNRDVSEEEFVETVEEVKYKETHYRSKQEEEDHEFRDPEGYRFCKHGEFC